MGVWLIGEYPRVRRVLDELEMVGIETALLSNTNAQHWDERLNDLESRSRFPAAARPRHRYASHELGLMKPDPAIFAALELSTRHEPARILFFDDLDENIEGARAAGWMGEVIDHRGDTAAQMLDALRRHEVIG